MEIQTVTQSSGSIPANRCPPDFAQALFAVGNPLFWFPQCHTRPISDWR
jgi:hypothetical protein